MSVAEPHFQYELENIEHSTTQFKFDNETYVALQFVNYAQQYCPTEESLKRLAIKIKSPSEQYKNHFKISTTDEGTDYLFEVEYIKEANDLIYEINRRLRNYGLIMTSPKISSDNNDNVYSYYRITKTDIWNTDNKLTNTINTSNMFTPHLMPTIPTSNI